MEGTFESTQEGISASLGHPRGSISRVLKKLMEEEKVEETLRHVPGVNKRRRCYLLIGEGLEKATQLHTNIAEIELIQFCPGEDPELTLGRVREDLYHEGTQVDVFQILLAAQTADDLQGVKDHVRSAKAISERDDYTSAYFHAPDPKGFVGRDEELDGLVQVFSSGSERVQVLTGIAGIGKTTLSLKLAQRLGQINHVFWLKIQRWDTLRSVLRMLGQFLEGLGRPVLGRHLESGGTLSLGEELPLVAEQLDGIPCLLVFDDYHLSRDNRGVVDLFTALVDMSRNHDRLRLLFSGRFRLPVYDRRLVAVDHHVREMDLEGLSRDATATLLGNRSARATQVHNLTGGHPLSIELIAAGDHYWDGEALRLEGTDVRHFIREEIFEPLPDSSRTFLQVLSVYRNPLPAEMVDLLAETIPREEIDQLAHQALLNWGPEGLQLHEVIRDFFYTRLDPQRRARLHEEAAGLYLQREAAAWEVAEGIHHCLSAGDHEGVAGALLDGAGARLIRQGWLEELLLILEQMDLQRLSTPRRCGLLALQGEALHLTGEWDRAVAVLNEARAVAEEEGEMEDVGRTMLLLGRALETQSQHDEAQGHYQKALELLPPGEMRLETRFELARLDWRLSASPGVLDPLGEICDGALAQNLGHLLARARLHRAMVRLTVEDETIPARDEINESVQRLEQDGDLVELGRALNNLAVGWMSRGDLRRADQFFLRAEKLANQTGFARLKASALQARGEIAARRGRAATGLEQLEEAEELMIRLGDNYGIAHVELSRAIALKASGRDGAQNLDRATQILRDLGLETEARQFAAKWAEVE